MKKNKKENVQKHTKQKLDMGKILTKVMALFLAVMLVIGMGATVIFYLLSA